MPGTDNENMANLPIPGEKAFPENIDPHVLAQDAQRAILTARHRDYLVDDGLNLGLPLEKIILAMTERWEAQKERIEQLTKIAPRRVRFGGEWVVWRCPDNMVPTL